MSKELLLGIVSFITLLNVGIFVYRVHLEVKKKTLILFTKKSHLVGLILWGSILVILLITIISISLYLLK